MLFSDFMLLLTCCWFFGGAAHLSFKRNTRKS